MKIWKDNKLFGRYLSWYRWQVVKILYFEEKGEIIVGWFEKLVLVGGSISMIALAVEKWSGWMMPYWVIIILALFIRLLKIWVGGQDVKKLKFGQAMSEFPVRERLAPVGNEQLDRIKNIERKVAPETFEEQHATYQK